MRRLTYYRGAWQFEVYLDFTCWMLGVNYSPPVSKFPAVYFHIGPIILGGFRFRPT